MPYKYKNRIIFKRPVVEFFRYKIIYEMRFYIAPHVSKLNTNIATTVGTLFILCHR